MNWTPNRTRVALGLLRQFDPPFRRSLAVGIGASLGVVLLRLAIPWPLKSIVEIVIRPNFPASGTISVQTSSWAGDLLWLTLLFVAISASLGLAELVQRVSLKKYTASTVHRIRESAIHSIASGTTSVSYDAPDLISRIISDTARIKAELSGILLHATQSALLYLGICIVFLFLSPLLGLVFFLGGVLTVFIGIRASHRIAPISLKQREKEADYAGVLQDAIDGGQLDFRNRDLNSESEERDVRTTRLIARTTLQIHIILAVITAAALWFSVYEVSTGALLPGELFLFIAYVLTVHRRMVRLGRQLARGGKLVANLTRLSELTHSAEDVPNLDVIEEMNDGLSLRDVSVKTHHASRFRKSLRHVDLAISRGDKIALYGSLGSGKSTLLEILAGKAEAEGSLLCDGHPFSRSQLRLLRGVRYLPPSVVFRRQSLSEFVGGSPLTHLNPAATQALGLKRLLRSARKDVRTKVSSNRLTHLEAKGLVLYQIIHDPESRIWLLDTPTEGLSKRKAARMIELIIALAGDRTVIMALPSVARADLFTQIVGFKNGKIIFKGSENEWYVQKKERLTAVNNEY